MEKIEKISGIPDEGMIEWIKLLRESDLTEKEIDNFLARLNETYAKEKGIKNIEKMVAEELAATEQYLFKEHGKILTKEQREHLKQGIEQRLRE